MQNGQKIVKTMYLNHLNFQQMFGTKRMQNLDRNYAECAKSGNLFLHRQHTTVLMGVHWHPFFCIFVLSIDRRYIMSIGNTRVEEQLQKAVQLNDAIAWFDAHTPEVKKLVVELIKFAQLKNKGVDKFNEIIGTYSQTTQLINPQKIAGTPYTLEDTGLFYRSMVVVVLKDSILIDATTAHMENETWWSTNILGLNEQNLAIYTEKIRQNFIKYARKFLGIN